MELEIVQVPRPAFAFCRFGLTALLWAALGFRQPWLVGVVFLLLAVSAVVKVHRAPMVWLFKVTVLRIWPTERYEFLDVAAMRFAHALGALLALICLVMWEWRAGIGWYFVLGFCLLKTVSALGFCPASKLFVCLRKGGCCALTKARC